MNKKLATYSFLPWLRRGIANRISGHASGARATIPVELKITGTGISGEKQELINREIALYGPGDIIGISKNNIVKTAPLKGITNFESNYLPYIEFYDEDFPWRYSPAVPDAKGRLLPWMALIILKDDEWNRPRKTSGKTLPFFRFKGSPDAVFPPFDQLWAWAHVHTNESIQKNGKIKVSSPDDLDKALLGFETTLSKNPDLAYSRILCPRKLEPDTGYNAFLIPSFESGRLAGLGLEIPGSLNALQSSWKNYTDKPEANHYPYYYSWHFSTGSLGNFEYLARLLKPQPIDSRVGTRAMDVQRPGVNVPGITSPELGGILRLGGALRVPVITMNPEERTEFEKYDKWDDDFPQPFQEGLASFINLADTYKQKTAEAANEEYGLDPAANEEDKDPLITAPLYGTWHALQQRLLKKPDGEPLPNQTNWVHRLNLDPRYRVPAGFGTEVIQKNQENYMEAAWKQVGDILEANQKIRMAQLAKAASQIWHTRHLGPVLENNPEKALQLMAPVAPRILFENKTVRQTLTESKIPPVFILPEMRTFLHPKNALIKKLYPEGAAEDDLAVIEKINSGEIDPAPPKKAADTLPTLQDEAENQQQLEDNRPVSVFEKIAEKYSAHRWAFLILAIILLILSFLLNPPLSVIFLILALLFAYLFYLTGKKKEKPASEILNEDSIHPDFVNSMPKIPDFRLVDFESGNLPDFGETDSEEALSIKEAFRNNYETIAASRELGEEKTGPPLPVQAVAETMYQAVDPSLTIPRLIASQILIPARIKDQMTEDFTEVMVYPEIDIPMYKPLEEISSELLLPNIQHVANNSISLMETNPKFIESYMMGLNHEFARELLWREYPTDQRGSYFRQFWDASSHLPAGSGNEEEQKEKLRDITPIHRWRKDSKLGSHDNRKQHGDKSDSEVVLVVRGELLKKYPSAVIYAHKASWQLKNDNSPDYNQARTLAEPEDEENPSPEIVKTPLYEAKISPDITFFGFDLKTDEVRGEKHPDKPGWFFVIKERPGEPQFGLDIKDSNPAGLETWADLSWEKAAPAGNFLEVKGSHQVLPAPAPGSSKTEQNEEDRQITWNSSMNAAELAYILYRAPVMIAIHASEMLPKQ